MSASRTGRKSWPSTPTSNCRAETIGTTFRNQASGLRHLAGQVLDDDFRSRLLEVALDYDHQAEKLESEFASQH
jgi:hypothetical protein